MIRAISRPIPNFFRQDFVINFATYVRVYPAATFLANTFTVRFIRLLCSYFNYTSSLEDHIKYCTVCPVSFDLLEIGAP